MCLAAGYVDGSCGDFIGEETESLKVSQATSFTASYVSVMSQPPQAPLPLYVTAAEVYF